MLSHFKTLQKRAAESLGKRKRLILRNIELRRLKRIRKKSVPAYKYCRNCGTELHGMYCHNCGQYALDVKQPFWKYLVQYFENVYQFDSKVWVTLWLLFRRPGFLTTEFNAGKIASYVHPMRLMMFISVLFFIFFFIFADNAVNKFMGDNTFGEVEENTFLNVMDSDNAFLLSKSLPKDTVVAVVADSAKIASFPTLFEIIECKPQSVPADADSDIARKDTMKLYLSHAILASMGYEESGSWKGIPFFHERKSAANQAERSYLFKERVMNGLKSYSTIVSLLLIPVLALLLMLLYRKAKIPYMGHFVFSLHISCFSFIMTALYMIVGKLWKYGGLPFYAFSLIILAYTVIASHWVYRGTGWIKDCIKTILLYLCYIFIVAITIGLIIGVLMYREKNLILDMNLT